MRYYLIKFYMWLSYDVFDILARFFKNEAWRLLESWEHEIKVKQFEREAEKVKESLKTGKKIESGIYLDRSQNKIMNIGDE